MLVFEAVAWAVNGDKVADVEQALFRGQDYAEVQAGGAQIAGDSSG